MSDAASSLEALAERFAHPSVRVMVRELSHLARDVQRGTLAWPRVPSSLIRQGTLLPGLESIARALQQQAAGEAKAINQNDWASFARTILGIVAASGTDTQPAAGAPHPASVIALRLLWGAERFTELPTAMLKPPPAPFLEHLTLLPAPERQTPPEQLDQSISSWLQENQPIGDDLLPAAEIRGFARVVAACRVVGQLRKALALEDVAAAYLAWARLLRANPKQLNDISSGWWSSPQSQPGRRSSNGNL